jgi:predicted NBD/HSP70 family sugar kinase
MPQWDNINIYKKFQDAFDIPVYVEHDANSGALAQYWFSQQNPQQRSLAFLLLGDGVGAGIVENGKLLLGAHGILGEIGHVSIDFDGVPCECGNRGCLERYCSIPEIEKYAHAAAKADKQSMLNEGDISLERLFECARAGDKASLGVVHKTAEYIGYGCVMLINAFNPGTLYLGERVADGWDMMKETINDVVGQRVFPLMRDRVSIMKSDLPIDPILLGAAAIATDEVLKLPTAFSRLLHSAKGRGDANGSKKK